MKIESHKEAFAEYLLYIERAKHSVEISKRLLLISCSQAATEAVSIVLHKLGIIYESTIIKHTQLDSKKWWNELPDFKEKNKISQFAAELERTRLLAYGTLKNMQSDEIIKNISILFQLKSIVEDVSNEKL